MNRLKSKHCGIVIDRNCFDEKDGFELEIEQTCCRDQDHDRRIYFDELPSANWPIVRTEENTRYFKVDGLSDD